MDRVQIKAEARAKIKGNLWTIWKPILVVGLISGVVSGILASIFKVDTTTTYKEGLTAYDGVSTLVELLLVPLTIGTLTYLLKFVRGEKPELNDVFGAMKNFVPIVVVTIIVGALVGIGCVLLLIPGIIIALMFSMTTYLLADGETNIGEVLRKSREMMNGHKWDFFVFGLSFFGWILLCIVTLGIAAIYVMPYMQVATCIYYEKLKALNK